MSNSSTTGGHPDDGTFAAGRAETSAPATRSEADSPANATNGPTVQGAAVHMLTVDARKVILIGTGLFFLAFLVLLPFWNWLGEHDHRVWLWTSLAGWLLGAAALPLIRKHSGEGRLG